MKTDSFAPLVGAVGGPVAAAISSEEEARYEQLQGMALDAARAGEGERLRPMLAAGMPVNLADAKGNSLLMLAAYHGHPHVVEMLLHAGADVDRRNDRGQTPLGGVAFKGNLPIARLLVEKGASLEADNGGGMTPLMYAALFGRREVADFLAEAGASTVARSRLGLSARRLGQISQLFGRLFRRPGKSAMG